MSHKAPRLIVIGSSNTDLVVACPRLPRPGETLLGGDFSRHAGGKGANQAVAAARGGARVEFVGARGDDEFGRQAEAHLKTEGVDTGRFGVRKGLPSGVALILLGGKSRDNVIAVARSANDTITAADVAKADGSIRLADALLCQLEIPLPAVQKAALLAARHKVPFILNPAPAQPLPPALLKKVHTLIPNKGEATILTGEKNPVKAARALRAMGCLNVAVTLGSMGAFFAGPGGEFSVSAPPVIPVDTVGAGDCFCAWLGLGIAEGLPPRQAVLRAVAAASLAVTRPGAQAGMPYRKEME